MLIACKNDFYAGLEEVVPEDELRLRYYYWYMVSERWSYKWTNDFGYGIEAIEDVRWYDRDYLLM